MHLTSDQLDRYVRGELSGAENQKVKRHLSSCHQCKQEAHFLSQIAHTLRSSDAKIKETPKHQTECPEEKQLFDYVAGLVTSEEKEKIEKHIIQCQNCQAILPTAKEIENFENFLAKPDILKQPVLVSSSWNRKVIEFFSAHRRQVGYAVAGLAIICVAIIQFYKTTPNVGERSEAEIEMVELVAPKEKVENLPFDFKWRTFANATRYVVIVWDSENPVERERVETTDLKVSASRISLLKPGKTYFWQVKAYVGTHLKGQSETRKLQIAD
jgi:predicted anti-sigma-YlaC factor YlaD